MKIRLGYACITETLPITTSKTLTYTEYLKNNDLNKLDSIIRENLNNLYEILIYNIKNNIHFYRLSSKIIPLSTKDDVIFDYKNTYKNEYQKISSIINKYNLRLDLHPDQFCILNSTKKEVLTNSINILEYHYNILEYIGIKDKLLVLHIGSSVLGKENSKRRFINNFKKLPKHIKETIAIENDDKIFTVEDCIDISTEINCPIILDYHHFKCNHNENDITKLLDDIFKSWKNKTPKMHFSSPKNNTKKEYRTHNDYINSSDFINFIEILSKYNKDVDIMIEAKKKDEAMFRLIRELKYKKNYYFIDDTSFIVDNSY